MYANSEIHPRTMGPAPYLRRKCHCGCNGRKRPFDFHIPAKPRDTTAKPSNVEALQRLLRRI